MSGRLGLLKGYFASVRDEVASKLRGTYVGNKAVVGGGVDQELPQVEYPQKIYQPPLDGPGYEQLVEPVVEVASEQVVQDAAEQEFLAEVSMHGMMQDGVFHGGPVGVAELSAVQEIDRAIDEAAGRGVLDEVAFESALDNSGFFDDVVVDDGPVGLEEVLGDPFGDQEIVDGLEAHFEEQMEEPMEELMAEEQMAQEQVMDDQFVGGFGGGGMF